MGMSGHAYSSLALSLQLLVVSHRGFRLLNSDE